LQLSYSPDGITHTCLLSSQSNFSFSPFGGRHEKAFLSSLLMVALAAGLSLTAFADTIRLKNGSVIRAKS